MRDLTRLKALGSPWSSKRLYRPIWTYANSTRYFRFASNVTPMLPSE